MSGLTKKQVKLMKNQISKLYGRNYIPLVTSDNTLSIGDILLSKNDISPIIDSSVFDESLTEFVEGSKVNKNIFSSAGINISTKIKGEAQLSDFFDIEEAGIAVEFTSNNQMFLKVQGIRQQSIKNLIDFRNKLLEMYTKGEVSSKVYIVRGLVYADKYYLQYSGTKNGAVCFNLNADISVADAEVNADFSFKWKKDVGYHIDAPNGGVLAYQVSGVRLKTHLIPETIQNRILSGMSEADALNMVSFEDRRTLFDNDALEVVDLTDEVLIAQDDEI